MRINRVIFWKEFKQERQSIKTIIGYIIIGLVVVLNYRKNHTLNQATFNSMYGVFIVSFFNSKNFYRHVDTILCLPITVREWCIYRAMCHMVRVFIWSCLCFAALSGLYGVRELGIMEAHRIPIIFEFFLCMAPIALLGEGLLVMYGKRAVYAILAFTCLMALIAQMTIWNHSVLINIGMLVSIGGVGLWMFKVLGNVNQEVIIRRWV